MTENQNNQLKKQSDSKSIQQSTQVISDFTKYQSNLNVQDTDEDEIETTFQRRPQFRLNEINRRNYFKCDF